MPPPAPTSGVDSPSPLLADEGLSEPILAEPAARWDLDVTVNRFELLPNTDYPQTLALPPLRLQAKCGAQRFSATTGATWDMADQRAASHNTHWWVGQSRASFSALPVEPCTLTIDEVGWAVETLEVGEFSSESLEATREAVLVVDVVDARGRPVEALLGVEGGQPAAAARARLAMAVRPPVDGQEQAAFLELPSGHLEFTGLSGGTLEISATGEGLSTVRQKIQLVSGETTTTRLVLEPAASLLVTLEGLDSGTPVAIWLCRQPGLSDNDRRLDGAGPFLFSGLPSGEAYLIVRLGGAEHQRPGQDLLTTFPFSLAPGQQQQLSLRLELVPVDVETEAQERVGLECSGEDGELRAHVDSVDGLARFRVPSGMRCRASLQRHSYSDGVEVAVPGTVRFRAPDPLPPSPPQPLERRRPLADFGHEGY